MVFSIHHELLIVVWGQPGRAAAQRRTTTALQSLERDELRHTALTPRGQNVEAEGIICRHLTWCQGYREVFRAREPSAANRQPTGAWTSSAHRWASVPWTWALPPR